MALRVNGLYKNCVNENGLTAALPDHCRALTLLQAMFGNEN